MTKYASLEERFWEKVDRRGHAECWPWVGRREPGGYGCLHRPGGGRTIKAHRLSYEIHHGQPPIQREGVEYEMDVVADLLDHGATCTISKSRCPTIAGEVLNKPGPAVAAKILAWLNDGVQSPAPAILAALNAATDSKTFLAAKDAANQARDRLSREEKLRVKAAIDDAALRVAEALAPANGKPEAPPTPRDEEGEDAAGPLFTS